MQADTTSHSLALRFRLVVFDMDDTLYPEIDYVRSGYQAVADHLARAAGRDRQVVFERMWHHFTAGDRRRVFDAILAEYGLAGRYTIPVLIQLYREHVPRICLDPSASEVLGRLRRAGCHLAVVTDGPLLMQQRKAQALNLPACVDRIVFTDALPAGCAKPSPAAFERLMHAFAVRPSSCVYVADNPRKDFLGPRQLGWQTVQLVRPGGVYCREVPPPDGEAHAQIQDLREILTLS